jgi:heme exporter protein C
MVFFYAPREATMGDVQRIFYFHVASAWVGFVAFFITCVASIIYLVRRQRRWDILALCSAEIGAAFIAMTIVTGSLWAKPVWGTYWTWEPRLTVSAVQLLIYVAYGILRASVDDPERKARFAAVYGIVAFATVPLSWFAIRWWRTIHPDILTGEGMAVTARMVHTLLASLAAFSLLYAALLRLRIRLERCTDALAHLRSQRKGAA